AALPARRHLLLAAQVAVVEVERLGLERGGEASRGRQDQMAAEVRLPTVEPLRLEERFEPLEELGRRDVQVGQGRKADALEVAAPRERRGERGELGGLHPV